MKNPISNRRLTAMTNWFLAAFDNNQNNGQRKTASQVFAAFCDEHGYPQAERDCFMAHIQSQGVM